VRSDRPTWVHRLHPLSKMVAALVATVLALALTDGAALLVLLGCVTALLLAARPRVPTQLLAAAALILGLVMGVNYLAKGDLRDSAHYSLRVGVLLLCTPILAATTAPQDTIRALARCRLPAGVTVALLLVWRFFPVLAREAAEIRQADRLRGPARGLIRRWFRGFLVPLTGVTVGYADQIALALELRGFDPAAKRTVYRPPQATWRDAVFLTLTLIAATAAAWVQWGSRA
jgi:energy-coupling factor transport system permease protein